MLRLDELIVRADGETLSVGESFLKLSSQFVYAHGNIFLKWWLS
jgi:hypothetical protein